MPERINACILLYVGRPDLYKVALVPLLIFLKYPKAAMLGPATNSDPQDSIYRTQILRCNLSHHRLFPKRHGFSYSYLMVGIPIRSTNSNWLVSVDTKKWWRRGMLFVTAKDHLNRGREGGSLSEKLDSYLRRQVSFKPRSRTVQEGLTRSERDWNLRHTRMCT